MIPYHIITWDKFASFYSTGIENDE